MWIHADLAIGNRNEFAQNSGEGASNEGAFAKYFRQGTLYQLPCKPESAVVNQCANPECNRELQYLREGRMCRILACSIVFIPDRAIEFHSRMVRLQEATMLSLRIEKLGDTTLIHCVGRMVFPYNREFRIRLLQQLQTPTLVLEFVDTIAIDASGLGLLVSLRTWATRTGRALKLMNVTPRVEQLLQMTSLKSEFEICSAREMLDLLCRAIHQSASTIARIEDSDVWASILAPMSPAAA